MRTAYVRPTYSGFHEIELSGGRILQAWWDGESNPDNTLDRICSPHQYFTEGRRARS